MGRVKDGIRRNTPILSHPSKILSILVQNLTITVHHSNHSHHSSQLKPTTSAGTLNAMATTTAQSGVCNIPERIDREPAPPLSESKVILYGTQGGDCNGCGTHFMPQHLTVDHIIARNKGGTSHLDNLQLLCAHCNSLKGGSADGVLEGEVGWGVGVLGYQRECH